jgi:general secretion pathway protein F
MTRFSYLAIDPDGRERHGGIDAASEQAARAALATRRLLPIEISHDLSRGVIRAQAASERMVGALSHKNRVLFTRQLATLVGAAVPVDEALGILAAQQEKPTVRHLLTDLRARIQEGTRLADAMSKHKRSFPGSYRAAIAGGERSGNLAAILTRLADHLQREHGMRAKITTAMIYPAALMLVATAVVGSLMVFVVPALVDQFKSFHGELPFITTVLIAVSGGLSQYWPLILLFLLGSVLLARAALKRPSVRLGVDAAILRSPVIGKWARLINTSRFIRSVATLVASGLPVLEGVRVSRDAASNQAFSQAVAVMSDRIEEGEPLSHAMRSSGLVPPMVIYMAVGGENTGELPDMLEKAADHLDQEFESFLQAAISLIEPAIIVLMGAIVAGIVLAIMLPILQLNQLATG